MSELRMIKLSDIEENEVSLRDVNEKSDGFKDLVESIRARGIMNPINVRAGDDDGRYVLVDGLHRYTAAAVAGLTEIPAHIMDLDEADVLEAQIEANLQKIETRPAQYAKQLERIMARHPERSLDEQAARLHKSPGWLRDRLSLNTLTGRSAQLVDEGTIPLSNAYALAKLFVVDPDEGEQWVDRAQQETAQEFCAPCLARKQEIAKAQRENREPEGPKGPPLRMRRVGDVKAEYHRVSSELESGKISGDRAEGYVEAFRWLLQQDDVSVEAWKRAEAERQRLKEEKAAKKAAAAAG